MTNELTCLNKVFEGNSIATLTYKGRPMWIAREIGTVIGYSHGGKRLANRITGEWSGEFAQDKDYAVLKDEELREFKELLGVAPEGPLEGLCRIPSMLILFESGLHLVLNKTNKPVGVRLRRFLADEVMPQIVRTGAYDPECRVEGEKVVDRGGDELRARREWRLVQRERRLQGRLEYDNKKLALNTVMSIVGTMGGEVSEDSLVTLKLMAIEIATGEDLSVFKPELDCDWESPSEIEEAIPQCNADWMEFPHHEAEEEERRDRIAAEQVARNRLERKRHEYELNRLLVRIFEDSFERLEGHVSNDLLVGLKFKLLDLLIGDDECTRIHMASRFPLGEGQQVLGPSRSR